MIIQTKGLTKHFKVPVKGEGLRNSVKDFFKRNYEIRKAVDNLDLGINEGEIVGLLGENGAGKTTTMKMLSGILYPTSGSVTAAGYKPTDRDRRYLMEMAFVTGSRNEVNWDLPVLDSLRYQQILYKISDHKYESNLKMLSKMLGVDNLLKIQLRRLSLGERMKMELLYNFIYSPSIVLMDEPTLGLDLKSQTAIRSFLRQYRHETKCTILMTSHYMDDIEETCDRVVILSKGRKSFDGSISTLKATHTAGKTLRMKFNDFYNIEALRKYGEVQIVSEDEICLNVESRDSKEIIENIIPLFPDVAEFSVSEMPFKDIVMTAMDKEEA